MRAEAIGDVVCELGESPLWMPDSVELAWLDITGRQLHRLRDGSDESSSLALSDVVTALGLTTTPEFVVATRSGFGRLDTATGTVYAIGEPLVTDPGSRMNDGGVAPDGSFWAGSYVPKEHAGSAALWRLQEGTGAARQLDGVTISNGLDWYADDPRVMLYVDSASGGVDRLELDDDGRVGSRVRFVDIDPQLGEPDGLTLDADGIAWVAIWGGSQVHGYDRAGRLQEVIDVPARHPSSCAFGGEDGRTLYITSALEGLSDPDPSDGRLFCRRLPCAGQPPRLYAG